MWLLFAITFNAITICYYFNSKNAVRMWRYLQTAGEGGLWPTFGGLQAVWEWSGKNSIVKANLRRNSIVKES